MQTATGMAKDGRGRGDPPPAAAAPETEAESSPAAPLAPSPSALVSPSSGGSSAVSSSVFTVSSGGSSRPSSVSTTGRGAKAAGLAGLGGGDGAGGGGNSDDSIGLPLNLIKGLRRKPGVAGGRANEENFVGRAGIVGRSWPHTPLPRRGASARQLWAWQTQAAVMEAVRASVPWPRLEPTKRPCSS